MARCSRSCSRGTSPITALGFICKIRFGIKGGGAQRSVDVPAAAVGAAAAGKSGARGCAERDDRRGAGEGAVHVGAEGGGAAGADVGRGAEETAAGGVHDL